MTVLTIQGKPMLEPVDINIAQALESSDTIFRIMWEECRGDAATFKHLRLHREDGSFDTVKSVLCRIERNIRFIQDAIGRSR